MISKKNRLNEREVKRVLQRWKPFFSYGIVLNSLPNKSYNNKFWIVIWWKSVNTNVSRNFFRRRFYEKIRLLLNKNIFSSWIDFVFVVKKQMKLDKKDFKSINSFDKDLDFLINKVNIWKQKY